MEKVTIKFKGSTSEYDANDWIDVRHYSNNDNLVTYDNLDELREVLIEKERHFCPEIVDNNNLSTILKETKELYFNKKMNKNKLIKLENSFIASVEVGLIYEDCDETKDFCPQILIDLGNNSDNILNIINEIDEANDKIKENHYFIRHLSNIESEIAIIKQEVAKINGDYFIANDSTNINVYPSTLEGYIACINEYGDPMADFSYEIED